MTKFFIAVLALALAYFAFVKRTEPLKEIKSEETVQSETQEQPTQQSAITARIPIGQAVTNLETPASATLETTTLQDENDKENELAPEVDQPRENVDQTIISNEKKLAGAHSSQEVIDLLRKLRFRLKNLDGISTTVTARDYAKFWGSYEGSVVNNRNEVLFGLKINLNAASDTNSKIIGKYQIAKPGLPPTTREFYDEFSAQLAGRDGLVIGSPDGHNFQLYKLDNGYLAGNYYEKTGRRIRTYRFILKNK
ncbi:hypothetical protein CIK05_15115 [Bdellovibrio sp. qaytius]|nr:hypothetical protein CIK05_15115 [Bdellovibrio sp. qaytius]